MSRYAPTLFVGLGGSGVKIIRSLKHKLRSDLASGFDQEPLAFLGIDYDEDSNSASDVVPPLEASEFRLYDHTEIANCVLGLDRTVVADEEGGDFRRQFEYIRDWYPDPDRRALNAPQIEARGASQWRPLGRIGFFLNDRQIAGNLLGALTELDRRSLGSATAADFRTAYIVCSIAGGTGAGLLFDVAVNLRRMRPGLSVRACLLLPEVFEQAQFTPRIEANAYATLWELANLKNQHTIFAANYPTLPPLTPATSPTPLQRVFLFGPYVGDLRPFRQPDDIYPFIADLLKLSISRGIRSAAMSAEANAAADSAVPLSSPESRHIFCTTMAMGLRLLDFAELARLLVVKLIGEIDDGNDRSPLLDLLAPRPAGSFTGNIETLIQKASDGLRPEWTFDDDYISARISWFFENRAPKRQVYTRQDLAEFIHDLEAFLGTSEPPSPGGPIIMAQLQKQFREELLRHLSAFESAYERRPLSCIRVAKRLLADVRTQLADLELRHPREVEHTRSFPQWLDSRAGWGTLTQDLIPVRISILENAVRDWFRSEVPEEARATWLKRAMLMAVEEELAKLTASHENRWKRLSALRDELNAGAGLMNGQDEGEVHNNFLDGRTSDLARTLERELKRVGGTSREQLLNELFDGVFRLYDVHAASADGSASPAVRDALQTIERTVTETLSRGRPNKTTGIPETLRFVSPASLFDDDEIRAAVIRCRPRVFQSGRVDMTSSSRAVRMLVPTGFDGRREFVERLRGFCSGLLASNVADRDDAGSDENRIIVVVDDLFFPAEAIAGIYDYHAQYVRQQHPLLLHINRHWPATFPPLITRPGLRGRLTCGNPNCRGDIKDLDRATIFCPSCLQPIRNRCGNRGCLVDDLAAWPNYNAIVESRVCAGCRNELRTSWWKCRDHGDVPMDKQHCRECVDEGRPLDDISRRPDFDRVFTCPSCVASGLRPFRVAGEITRYLVDGVDRQDFLRAEALFAAQLSRSAYCKVCGALLVPCCPVPDAIRDRPHYLYRTRKDGKAARFRCYAHLTESFERCSTCDFPVRSQDKVCPRCRTKLDHCRFCTPRFGLRIPVASETTAPCPNCNLPRAKPSKSSHTPPPNELFCSNLYGCPAGGRLDQNTFAAGTPRCRICRSDALPLMHVHARGAHIKACRLCRQVFCSDSAPPQPSQEKARDGHCCLCGRPFAATHKVSDEYLAKLVAITNALRCHDSDEDAFLAIQAAMQSDLGSLNKRLDEFVHGVTRPAVHDVVASRIGRIKDLWKREFGCRGEDSGSEPCGC